MSFVVRAGRASDLEALYAMAKSTGGGLTNLPPDRATLASRLQRAAAGFARDEEAPGDDLFLFVLEETESGRVCGTAQIFGKIGVAWPFYSYRIGALTQTSKELGRTFRAEMLTLSTDLDGASEVGGLFLHPGERASGVGALLARSRYLFMTAHRARFAARTIAELRGAVDESGNSAFWDAIGGRFFGMSFREADEFNGMHGNQFIADLMPKHPIYIAMLPESAVAAIGVPHVSGRAAMRMLEKEGFRYEHYVDIFDGGPTMTCATDDIATIREARGARVAALAGEAELARKGAAPSLLACGRLAAFRATNGLAMPVGEGEDNGIAIDAGAAARLGVKPGDAILHVAR